jgi:hypothetical protein
MKVNYFGGDEHPFASYGIFFKVGSLAPGQPLELCGWFK